MRKKTGNVFNDVDTLFNEAKKDDKWQENVNNEIDELKAALQSLTLVDVSKHGSTVSTTEWVHVGTKLTIPKGYVAVVTAERSWSSGKPTGVAICNDDTTFDGHDLSVSTVAENSQGNFVTTTIINTSLSDSDKTVYLWSKGAIGKTGEIMMAVLHKS